MPIPAPPPDLDGLATYLEAHWPDVRQGNTVQKALWLLEHLRRINASGALPSIGDDGEIVRGVQHTA